jgi:hypothetical protein
MRIVDELGFMADTAAAAADVGSGSWGVVGSIRPALQSCRAAHSCSCCVQRSTVLDVPQSDLK